MMSPPIASNDVDIEIVLSPGGMVLTSSHDLSESVDVHIHGHRVMSTALRLEANEMSSYSWPPVLVGRLGGLHQVTLSRSGDGAILGCTTGRLGPPGSELDLVDRRGRRLSVSKWGTLVPTISSGGSDVRTRMLDRTEDVIAVLQDAGHPAFVVGGTLLGAVRNGSLLPHDDDTDLAVLAPPESHPADLVLLSLRISAELEAQGWSVVRHSHSHLQVTFLLEDGLTDHYVDVFLAFYRDGWFFEPLAMQVPAPEVAIEPLCEVVLEGRRFPAPADPEAWLAACYGPHWRTPDPAFRFDVPSRTTRRFWNWFGNFDLHRSYWDSAPVEEDDDRPDVGSVFPVGHFIVDLGAGTGRQAASLVEQGRGVLAVDYSFAAVAALRRIPAMEVARVNLNDDDAMLRLAIRLARRSDTVSFYIGHTYEGLGADGKREVLTLLGRCLSPEARAVIDTYTTLPTGYLFEDPSTWHTEDSDLIRDLAFYGLKADRLDSGIRATRHGDRKWSRLAVSRTATP